MVTVVTSHNGHNNCTHKVVGLLGSGNCFLKNTTNVRTELYPLLRRKAGGILGKLR
jgi:hypothetical protein